MDVELAIETATGRVARRLEEAAEGVEYETERAVRDLGDDAELIFAAHALRRSGRLARGIAANAFADSVVITAEARDPATGFDYTAVTRFGHRVARIYPKKAKALRFEIDGRVVFAKSVRGFKPATDWRDDAMPEVNAQANAVMSRLGRRIEVMV